MSAAASPSAEPQAPPREQRWTALYVLCVGMLMIVLDVTVVNVALPAQLASRRWMR